MEDRLSRLNARGLPPDPWKRYYDMRYGSAQISRFENWKRTFPGLGWGFGLFLLLCGYEYVQKKSWFHRK
jgi:hypothetical protein